MDAYVMNRWKQFSVCVCVCVQMCTCTVYVAIINNVYIETAPTDQSGSTLVGASKGYNIP